jgi:hypothetical protein
MLYEASTKDAILRAPAVARHPVSSFGLVYVEVEVEHPSSGLQFLVGALACSAFLLSGCDASAPDVGDTGSSSPKVSGTGSSASAVGDIGTWELLNSTEVTSFSTTLRLGVTRLECASGVTGTVLDPRVRVEQERIVIRTDVEPLSPGGYTCQGNDAVPVTVELNEPIGKRELVDAACLGGRAVNTAPCTDNGVRWRP